MVVEDLIYLQLKKSVSCTTKSAGHGFFVQWEIPVNEMHQYGIYRKMVSVYFSLYAAAVLGGISF
jgi:hypothetical protein